MMTLNFDSLINSDRNFQEFLQVTVETTRKTLRCDRLIIYSASYLPNGLVIAESVDAKYNSILGTTIKDPFLTGEHLEMYCYGLPVTVNDIYTTDIIKSDLEEIEKLGVKSLAIVPISLENKLIALLVAHQYSQHQSWHSESINILIEKANAVSLAFSSITKLGRVECQDDQQTTKDQENHQPQIMKSKNTNNGNSNIQETEQKTKLQTNQHKSFSNAVVNITNEQGQDNILNTTVGEVRHLLNCDRVVIYSLNRDDYGVVIAESVAPGWTKALGKTIDDPCFATRYIDKYSQGRVRAWDNVYCEDATPCYLEQLEALEVKANLVTPIINEGKLFGLLIAHQCSGTRNWQEPEIKWIAEIATQVGIMLEYTNESTKILAKNNRQEPELSPENEEQWNQYFTDAIQYIRQSLKQEDILKASVKEVRRILNCDRVVIYSLNSERYGTIVAESVALGWIRAKGRVIKDPCFEAKYLEQYRNGRVRAWSNIYESGLTECYLEQLEELEVKANLVTPIINEGKLFGLLVAHQCSEFRNWQQPEIRWVAQIATQVGFALDNAQLLADAKRLQQQLDSEVKLTNYFTDAIRYIRESLQQEDILEVSVEEVRRVLKCDRVVVYSLNSEHHGMIVAESVASGWTRVQGRVIQDPCFEAKYLEQYRNGRVRAWSSIYEAGMTQCYIEQLEQIEVKANLVTPIVNEGKLFGLLVAHQCSEFRNWQQPEIRWLTQIATQVGFALDNAKLLVDSKRLQQKLQDESKWTEYLTDAIQHIRQSLKTEEILTTSVREVRRILECDRVVIYSLNSERYGMIVAESVAPGWTRVQGRVIQDPCFAAKYLEQYRNGRVRAWSNIYEAGMTQCYIEQLEQIEVKANLVTPIVNEGKLFGLLVAHQCSEFRNWQQPEIRWVAQIATQVGFALDNAKLLEQLQKSTKTTEQLSHQQHEQTELLKHQIIKLLTDNGDAYQNLSQEAMRQSETMINVLHQIQKVADSFNGITLNVQQVKFQEQQNDLAVQDTQKSLEHSVNHISNIQRTVQHMSKGFDNLNHSCQKLAAIIKTLEDLSKQIVQQSMSIARVVNRTQIETNSQNSVMDLSDTIFSLMQQLFEASAKVEPLFANIQTEIRDKIIALGSEIQQLSSDVGEFQTVRQKLDRVVALQNKMNIQIENISQAVENQTQSSTFAKDSMQDVASIAERISEQSMTITHSFNQLVLLVQRL